jgi:hypothetical protein
MRRALVIFCEKSLGIQEGCGEKSLEIPSLWAPENDNPNPVIHQGQV